MVSLWAIFGIVSFFCKGTIVESHNYDIGHELFLQSSKHSDPRYRLPKQHVNILHYDLHFTPHFYGLRKFTFDAKVVMTLDAMVPNVTSIQLHASQLIFENITLRTNFAEVLETIPKHLIHPINQKYEFWTVVFSKELPVNKELFLEIHYAGYLQTNQVGFFVSEYFEDGITKYLAATQFEPANARKAFPCFDEPEYKSKFTINLNRPKHFSASLSNTKLYGVSLMNGEYVLDVFHTTPLMSTYLVAFLISELHPVEESCMFEKDRIAVRGKYETESMGGYALRLIRKATREMGKYLNYPLEKMHRYLKNEHVAMPDFVNGAMENWGLAMYKEHFLMYSENETSIRYKQQIASILSHEISHIWFGNLVTLKWWSNVWLNEGFARYFEYYLTDKVENMNTSQQFNLLVVQKALDADSFPNDIKLNNPNINSPDEIKTMFGRRTYNKGAAVIRMVRDLLGDYTFDRALGRYIEDMKFKNADPEDLYRNLQSQADIDNSLTSYSIQIEEFMSSWTKQSGYPLITLEINRINDTMTISQDDFNNPESSNNLWHVPITWSTRDIPEYDNLKPKLILSDRSVNIPITLHENEWMVLNNKQSGFYRVNYDEQTWTLLKFALSGVQRNKIHPMNRAQIVNDLFALAEKSLMTYNQFFFVLSFLKSETDPIPWFSAFEGFKRLRLNMQHREDLITELKKYVSTLLPKVMNHVESQKGFKNNWLAQLFEMDTMNFACLFEYGNCLQEAKTLFDSHKNDNFKNLEPNSREYVYCYGLKQSLPEDYEILWKKYLYENTASEKIVLLNTLGCITDKEKVQKFLYQTITEDSPILSQDKMVVIKSVMRGGVNHVKIVYEFFKDNILRIRKIFGNQSLAILIKRLAMAMNVEQLEALKATILGSKYFTENEKNSTEKWIERVKKEKTKHFNTLDGLFHIKNIY